MKNKYRNSNRRDGFLTRRGISLIETVVGISLMLIIFIGLFGVFQLSLQLIDINKAKVGAISLANEQIEYMRSLPYNDVGTVGGIPSGNLLQEEDITMNQKVFTRRTFIQYVDAPQDGVGASDTNGITADYKVVKTEMLWTMRGKVKKFTLVTNIIPRGVETLAGGGTLTIQVYDAVGVPVPSADVTITNDTVSPAINITTSTNTDGRASFPGAPVAVDYKITATKAGYSMAQTYDADASNPSPSPGHLTVVLNTTTTSSFIIDRTSSKTVNTFEPVVEKTFADPYTGEALIFATSSTEVMSGELRLLYNGLDYASIGTVVDKQASDSDISGWNTFSWNNTVPANTEIRYRLKYMNAGAPVLIPDTELPGNSAGFTLSPVNISSIDVETYPALMMDAELSTLDTAVTPAILDWQLAYDVGPVPLPNILFVMRGDKTIGADSGGLPIYKYSQTLQTDSGGEITINNLEWDNYMITVDGTTSGYDVSVSCNPQPLSLLPNTAVSTNLYLTATNPNSLIVAVFDDSGLLFSGASARLYRSAYDTTQTTALCGQTFFNDLASGTVVGGNAYSLSVSAPGFQTTLIEDSVEVSGASTISITLNP